MQSKVAIITGASKGIGRQAAIQFAEAGYQTVLVARNREDLQQVHKELNNASLILAGDLADIDFVQSIAKATLEQFGRIDVLINNAAWRTIETMRTIHFSTWEQTLRICLTAPAFLSQACAEVMEAQQIKGCIINISSVMSNKSAGTSPAYIACKGALEALSRELAVTYGRNGVRVLTIRPGYIDTDLSNDYTSDKGDNISTQLTQELVDFIPANTAGTPQQVADALVWLASEQAAYITGCELTIDGGFSANFSSYPLKHLQFPAQY